MSKTRLGKHSAQRRTKNSGKSKHPKMQPEPLVLLHGLFRRPRSMGTPARWLASQGFETHNLAYPSRQRPIEELAREIGGDLERRFGTELRRVHFLTHSMGAIVLRQLMTLHEDGSVPRSWKLGRVVMLAPPNQGSVLAEALGDWWPFRFLFKQAGQELRARSGSPIPNLPVPPQTGLVAGTRSVGAYRRALRGKPEASWPNDGTIAVKEVSLGEAPVVTVPAMHAFIMNNREALEHAVVFFRSGRFSE